jgi:hypothetical protein
MKIAAPPSPLSISISAAVLVLTLLSSGRPGTEVDLLLGDLRPLAVPKYALPLVLFACGACLCLVQRPDSTLRQVTLAGAGKTLNAWSGIASAMRGWLLGVAVLASSQTPTNVLPAAAVLAFGIAVFLGPSSCWRKRSASLRMPSGACSFQRSGAT